MKILVSDDLPEVGIERLRGIPGIEVDVQTTLSPEELKGVIGDYDALIIRSATRATGELIEAAHRLRVIARAGIGLDNVDIPAASKRGIVVMNTPEGNVITTAEHTISMIMAVSRNIPQASASLKAGKWEKKKFQGREVFNKTLGVIGVGRIGRVVADRAHGLKMQVVAYDPYINADAVNALGIEAVTLEDLFARSDYITVHTPLTPETRGIIGRAAIEKMKHGVFIVNCARGGIVDEQALLEALATGKVAGAALDVFTQEPPKDNALLALDHVVVTPHLGASTDEAQENVSLAVADQVLDYLQTGTIRNAVNAPAMDGQVLARLQPYITLCEKLGSILFQITRGPVESISIEYVGEAAGKDRRPLTISVLRGVLLPILGEMVNFVNAPVIARERNIKVTESVRGEAEDFTNLVSIRMKTPEGENLVAGTIFGKKDPRLVRINDFRLEAAPEGNLLLISSIDKPGTIGAIATCLGKSHINISMMDVGLVQERGENIILIRTDTEVPPAVLEELLALANVNQVQALRV